MPIVGFHDALSGRNFPLDRLDECRSWEPSILRAMAAKEEGDERHSGTSLTVTAGFGCPRRTGIERFLPIYPDPQKMNAAFMGTLLHESFARIKADEAGSDWTVELPGEKETEFSGRLLGHEVSCKVDAFEVDGEADPPLVTVIRDYKTTMSGGDKWVDASRRASPHHAAQLNANRLLMEQNGVEMSPDLQMEAWVVGATWQRTLAPKMNEEEIGATQVGVTKESTKRGLKVWTYRQLLDDTAKLFKSVEEGVEVKTTLASMPLYGESMWVSREGNNACGGCAVRRECGALNGRL